MRRWIPIALIVLAVLWFILANVGSSMALSDITTRPILAFAKDGQRVPVQQPGQPAAEGEAQVQGGEGVLFGYRFAYRLPGGETVLCSIRFRGLTCTGGWTPERKP
jgi:hypothetical protein